MRRNTGIGLAALLAFGATAIGQATLPAAMPTHQPLSFWDHASWTEPHKEIPLLLAGRLPDGVSSPNAYTPNLERTWNTIFNDDTRMIEGILKAGGTFRGVDTAGVSLLLAAPMSGTSSWMPSGITRNGQNLTIQVTAWDAKKGNNAQPDPTQRLVYLFGLSRLPAGKYNLMLNCTHFESDEHGLYWPSGEREEATTVLSVTEKGIDPPAKIEEKDLKKLLADVKRGTTSFVPPLHWARQVFGVAGAGFELKVGTMDARAFIEKPPTRGVEMPVPVPQPEGQDSTAEELYASIVGPTLNSGEFLTMNSITTDGNGYMIHVDVWRDSGGRSANARSKTVLLVPLSFLKKGEQRITLKWREYHARTMLEPYELMDKPPSPDVTIKVRVK